MTGGSAFPPAVLLAALPLLVGCGGDDPTGPVGGEPPQSGFSIEVSGDLSRTIDGEAGGFWTVAGTDGAEDAFVLDLSTGPAGALEGIEFIVRGRRPAPGDYSLSLIDQNGDLEGVAGAIVVVNVGDAGSGFIGTSAVGTLTIRESTRERVRGSFTFSAQGTLFSSSAPPTPGVIAIRGAFAASPMEPTPLPGGGAPPAAP